MLQDASLYGKWDVEVAILFTTKDLIDNVSGTEKFVVCENDKMKKWKQKYSREKHYIKRIINKKFKSHVLCWETSKEL